jgi:hypothetical protein
LRACKQTTRMNVQVSSGVEFNPACSSFNETHAHVCSVGQCGTSGNPARSRSRGHRAGLALPVSPSPSEPLARWPVAGSHDRLERLAPQRALHQFRRLHYGGEPAPLVAVGGQHSVDRVRRHRLAELGAGDTVALARPTGSRSGRGEQSWPGWQDAGGSCVTAQVRGHSSISHPTAAVSHIRISAVPGSTLRSPGVHASSPVFELAFNIFATNQLTSKSRTIRIHQIDNLEPRARGAGIVGPSHCRAYPPPQQWRFTGRVADSIDAHSRPYVTLRDYPETLA